MSGKTLGSRGFTLIASLLMLLLLSGIAIGLLMMVNTEGKVGGADVQNNLAYHNAEGGIEKMTADLAAAFQNAQAPLASDICALGANPPVIAGVTWKEYTVTPATGCSAPLKGAKGKTADGLWAQLIPVNMLATAAQTGGQEVSMMRTAQVALVPVFQFGVFCEGDCSFFSGPNFDFAGRVHTNGDLYPEVGPGSTLTFHDRLTVYGNVVRAKLANGFSTAAQYNGTVEIPKGAGGCDAGKPNCRALGMTEGSVTGAGGNPPQSAQNGGWPTISVSNYNSQIIDGNYGNAGGTGAKKLSLPFVNGTTFPYEIIRRPPVGESDTSTLGQSREYNMAQIRVLLSDDPAELPFGAADANNVRLANFVNPGPDYSRGVPLTGAAATTRTYFAEGNTATKDPSGAAACLSNANLAGLFADWPAAPTAAPAGAQTLQPIPVAPLIPATPGTWNLLDGYLRVEYKNAADNWIPVTREWLELGFARGTTPPAAIGGNPIHPNAILILQQPADRNGNGVLDPASGGVCSGGTPNHRPAELPPDVTTGSPYFGISTQPTSLTRTNWYPINFYDVREGEVRDNGVANNSGTANGVMNAVELDVGNLKRWLAGAIGANGTNVDFAAQNGYVLYFSDRRGMLKNPNPPYLGLAKSGDSGLEDTINAASANGVPDGVLDPIPAGKSFSSEDVNQNLRLDNFGAGNLGLGFYNYSGLPPAPANTNINGKIVAVNPDDPYAAGNAGNRILLLASTARKNWVSGARHVLRLVDGGYGNLPVRTDTVPPVQPGGFTVASENPVYILGNYNSDATDPAWAGGADNVTKHANAAVIADAVTFLSTNWLDLNSMMVVPTSYANRQASDTRYRLAIAGGKNMNFPQPIWGGVGQDFGTDGGVHNFLRYLEDWGGNTLWYKGSLVSLYYATYNTGVYKCCDIVYSPPTRNYSFDSTFLDAFGLPPGTPLFRDVDNLSYRQIFTTRTY